MMWIDESSKRREQNMSEVKSLDRLYCAYLRRVQNPNGRAPQPQRLGDLLKEKLKIAKSRLRNEKRRKQQELSTKEFFTKYKIPHIMQWVAELEITPDWNNPDAKRGAALTTDAILRVGTTYYRWLFTDKDSDPVSANQMLGTLSSDNPLRQEDSDKCEGEITEKEVFETMRNLPREKAMGPHRTNSTKHSPD